MTDLTGPQVGDAAPEFSLPSDSGGTLALPAFAGRQLVLYFYPKDDTPGCTAEAQQFSALASEFAAIGASVIGVSRDSAARHARFRSKYGLTIDLGADDDGAVTTAYGVWVEKSLYGRKYLGIERATFLIGSDGRVERVWRKVKVQGHAAQVLAAAQAQR